MQDSITLTFSCPDQPNISATVLSFFANQGYNIVESSQHEDSYTEHFFMRTVFIPLGNIALTIDELRAEFSSIAESYKMEWNVRENKVRPRILIAVT